MIDDASRRPAEVWLTAHARARCRQRGTPMAVLTALLDWADVEVRLDRGVQALSTSQEIEPDLRQEGFPRDMIDRVRRRALVAAEGRVLTIVAGLRFRRHYRHRFWVRDRRCLAGRRWRP